jgi:hypothetical protein
MRPHNEQNVSPKLDEKTRMAKCDDSDSPACEPHFSVKEVAALWSLSKDAVRDIFRHEDGVLAIGTIRTRGKRQYLTLRIPASVLERVHRKLLSNQYRKA